MNVTLVAPYDPFPDPDSSQAAHVGGVERVLLEFAQRLKRRGHDVTMLCSTAGPDDTIDHDGIVFERVRRTGTLFRDPIVNLAAHIPPTSDVVHVPATYPSTTPRVLRRAHRLGIATVLDFHFEPCPPSTLARAAATVYRRIVPPASYPFSDAVLVRSLAYGRSAPSLAKNVPEARWRILPNGIDPERFHAGGRTEPGDYLLFTGRLVPYKGVDVLLNALKRDPPGLPLLIAGDGPQRTRLERIAKRLGVDAQFLGHVPEDRLSDLYRRARITILPSVHRQEAFGISLVESMACGTPVVASDLPGVGDVAREGGIAVPPQDPAALAEGIKHAIIPDALPRGGALEARIHERFSWDVLTARLVEVYAEAREARRPHTNGATIHAHPRRDTVL